MKVKAAARIYANAMTFTFPNTNNNEKKAV